MSDRDTIERAIRHIDSCLDGDPWARDIAIDAMKRLLKQAGCRQVTGKLDIWDALSRVYNMDGVPDEAKSIILDVMLCLPSEEPEPERNTASEQPVSDRLGVKTCKTYTDTISRQAAIGALLEAYPDNMDVEFILSKLPSVQPERKTGNWTRISIDRYTQHAQAWYRCSECQGEFIGKWNYCPNCGSYNGGNEWYEGCKTCIRLHSYKTDNYEEEHT